jgi:hypothetical protein
LSDASLVSLLAPSWSCPVASSSQGAHQAPTSLEAPLARRLPLYWLFGISVRNKQEKSCLLDLFYEVDNEEKIGLIVINSVFWNGYSM